MQMEDLKQAADFRISTTGRESEAYTRRPTAELQAAVAAAATAENNSKVWEGEVDAIRGDTLEANALLERERHYKAVQGVMPPGWPRVNIRAS